MLSSESIRKMINNLKGRVSKCLVIPRALSDDELVSLDGIYTTIDNIILNKKLTKTKALKFKKLLKEYGRLIQSSEKAYIQEHILPVIEKLTKQEWIS